MLQKNPELRPSAKDIFTTALPPLTSMFRPQEEEEEMEDSSDMAKTLTKYVCVVHLLQCLAGH